MTEPAGTAYSFAAGMTGVFVALLGVPPMALMWAFIGAGAMLIYARRDSKRGELLSVVASGLVGAAGGQFAEHLSGGGSPVLIIASLVIGAGAKPILSAAIARVERWVEGGK